MQTRHTSALLFLIILMCYSSAAYSQTSACPDAAPFYETDSSDEMGTGDETALLHWCNSPGSYDSSWVASVWMNYGFINRTWEDLGYYDVCNNDKPLTRMLNATYQLEHYKKENVNSRTLDILKNEARQKISVTAGSCSTDARARATWFPRRRVTYMVPLFYAHSEAGNPESVAERASTIVHEARHMRRLHNGGNGCGRGSGCDTNWNYSGANAAQVRWLIDMYKYGKLISGWHYTGCSDSYDVLKDKADYLLNEAFNQTPNITVDPKICGWHIDLLGW